MPIGVNDLTWNNILMNDNVRSLDPDAQAQFKSQWLRSVAPILYPQIREDREALAGIRQYVYGSQFIPRREYEDDVIRPESLNYGTGFASVEANSTYRRLNFGEQQEMKQLWYAKMSNADPEFQQLDSEQQNGYFQRLMERAPGYGTGSTPLQWRNSTGLFEPIPMEKLHDPTFIVEDDIKGWQKFMQNFTSSLVTEFGALVTAPLRWIAPDNPVSEWFLDARKQRDWMNWADNQADWLTEGVASFTGTMTGILLGPYLGVERLAAKGGAALLGKITTRVPQIVGASAAAGVTGMVQGIASAVTEGRPWNSNLLGDATLGVGLEFITRYAAAFRQVHKAADSMGTTARQLMRPEYDPARPGSLTPELERVMAGTPGMGQFVREAGLVDPHGFLLESIYKPEGINMVAKMLDLNVVHGADAVEVRRGEEVLKRFTGSVEARNYNAAKWMFVDDAAWDTWAKTSKGKSIMELIDTAGSIEVRRGFEVPQAARNHIDDFFTTHGMFGYFSPAPGVREATLAMDDIYTVLRRERIKKIPDALASRGIVFDGSPDAHATATMQLRAELLQRFPDKPYFIVNASEAGKSRVVSIGDVPTALLEDPRLKNPFSHQETFVGNSRMVRNVLSNLKKKYTDIKRATTMEVKNKQGTIQQYLDSQVVELRAQVPDGTGNLHEVILHFPSIKAAIDGLQKGFNHGVKGMVDTLFKGLDAGTRKKYDDFVRAFKESHPERYNSEFLPYLYAVKQAEQNGMSVGMLGGRYVVEDTLDNVHKYVTFDNLNDVYRHLEQLDGRHISPDMTPGVSQSAIAVTEPDGIRDPMRSLPERDMPKATQMGLRSWLTRMGAPTQWAIQKLENTEAAGWLRSKGFSITEMYNRTQDANNAVRSFIGQRQRTIKRVTKGLSKDQSTMVYRYLEALDSETEFRSLGDLAAKFETKDTVFRAMADQFGDVRAAELQDTAVEIGKYFDDLFSRMGMNFGSFIQHYMPHIRSEAAKKMTHLSTDILDYTSKLNIPEADKIPFFRMMRDTDPKKVIFETDVRKLMETYTHLAGRDLFMMPTMRQLRDPLRDIISSLKETGGVRQDYEQLVRYISNFFEATDGVHSMMDDALRKATEETLNNIAKLTDTKLGTHWQKRLMTRRVSVVDSMITMSTGAHIAGRMFSAGRNMTQSLVTAGSLLGLDWWMKGLDDTFRPGGLARLESLGIINVNKMPLPGWDTMDIDNRVRWAINKGMTPFKEADAINRAISYYAGEARARNAIDLLRKRKLTPDAFGRVSGARLYGIPNYNEASKILNSARNADEGVEAFSHRLGLLAVERTQYLYNNFDQPQIFRKGIGRFAGQYTSWPINFMNLVHNVVSPRSGMPAIERVGFIARLSTVTGSIAYGLHSAGIGSNSFMPWNMMTVSAGPHFQMVTDLAQGIGGDRNSFMSFIKSYVNFIPFAYEGESVLRSLQAFRDGEFVEALLLLSSAPLRTDVYPRREIFTDRIEEELFSLGNKYIEWMGDVPGRVENRAEAVGGIFN